MPMRNQKAITAAEAIVGPEDRLVMDLACETCGSEHWEKVDLEGRLYYRCAGSWANGDDCRRLRPIPILVDPAPISNLEGEAPTSLASSPRKGDGSADFETARKAMIADAQAVSQKPEVRRAREVEKAARGLKAISDARWAGRPGARPAPTPIEVYEDFFRGRIK